jgi:hypothetical protein
MRNFNSVKSQLLEKYKELDSDFILYVCKLYEQAVLDAIDDTAWDLGFQWKQKLKKALTKRAERG